MEFKQKARGELEYGVGNGDIRLGISDCGLRIFLSANLSSSGGPPMAAPMK